MGVETRASYSPRWIQGCPCPFLRGSREKPHCSLWFWPTTLRVPSGPRCAPATSLPQLPHSHTDSEGRLEIRGRCAHRQLPRGSSRFKKKERRCGVGETKVNDEQQMAFPLRIKWALIKRAVCALSANKKHAGRSDRVSGLARRVQQLD